MRRLFLGHGSFSFKRFEMLVADQRENDRVEAAPHRPVGEFHEMFGQASTRLRGLGRVPLRNARGEPLVYFSLDPGDAMIAYRYWFGKFAAFPFPAQVIPTVVDPLDRTETFEIDQPHAHLASKNAQRIMTRLRAR
jgi:hypothetical protein